MSGEETDLKGYDMMREVPVKTSLVPPGAAIAP